MRIDAEKGEGVDLAKKYNVRGYPTTVFVNPEGEEIDRIVGYLPTDEFLQELKRINEGKNTYSSLREKAMESPENIEVLKAFAGKIEQRNQQSDKALELWKRIATLAESNSSDMLLAEYKIAEYQSITTQSPEPLLKYINEYPETENQIQAYLQVMQIYRNNDETGKEVETFREFVNKAVEQGNLSVNLLNSYAWRMAELETNLEDALEKIKLAVANLENAGAEQRAQVKDTHAEVLWKMGRTENAVEIIEECIALQPEDNYYKEQKQKFLDQVG